MRKLGSTQRNLRRSYLLLGAAALAKDLHRDMGYSRGSAALTAAELFPEVTDDEINSINKWGAAC